MRNAVETTWTDVKNNLTNRNLIAQYVEDTYRYRVYCLDLDFQIYCELDKEAIDTTDLDDFETNFKPTGNAALSRDVIVDNNVTLNSSPSDLVGCDSISPKLRVDYSGTNQSITSSYTTVYSYSGSGKLFGFVLDFNSDSVRVKFTIDGTEQIFELTLNQIEDLQAYSSGGCDDSSNTDDGLLGFFKKASGNKLYFQPLHCIVYYSEVKIEAQRTGSSNKTLDDYLVILTKES